MYYDDLVMNFKNEGQETLYIIIDPPVWEFDLAPGEALQFRIVDYHRSAAGNNIMDIRYSSPDCINIDILYPLELRVFYRGEDIKIWSASR
ncbi:hypothetical protein [Chitinophaga pinensis]|uniref:Uncharacterized protein n=1 Tax=Chitinophaga pinensis (strain ATCC 43595 / DSM 2588 / LMG 13176 / NBRC 15968 / NCIMB 11800 / UQM 2034) TaxID=485918 RepID=A0A979GTN5_CHIPD|nr:hypothetical protein [Chitinophaga pinensis]ACU62208.1 hypothetical protein Cpin_4773 [Chitinophaga pinensis DSM 2588]